ncbi:MAG TPA: 4'-phosphopantetheinyl transferase superfamily protein [Vicinamibacterales bacterium]|nr:4'-phosphopantetheinyl transferase superfamily protein [Vicinamibacterales bacterium]
MFSVDVYIATVRAFGPRLEDAALPLSDLERERAARFNHLSDRWEFVLGRLMARHLLAERCGTPAGEFRFVENEHGRPDIAHPSLDRPLRFNLSHSGGLVACVIGEAGQVGVDVERLDRPPVDPRVIRRYCSEGEQAALAEMPEALRHERFLQLWTLKEAYVKARGTGLTLPLRQVSFDLGIEGPGDVSFNGVDEEARWMFAHTKLEPRHLLAVAAEREPNADAGLRLRTFSPEDAHLA